VCGRFISVESSSRIAEYFGIAEELDPALSSWKPRYNVAPTQLVRCVLHESGSANPTVRALRWGLIPRWQPAKSQPSTIINARSETVADKPSFRESFAQRRCIVPMSGFYEWIQATPSQRSIASGAPRRQPYLITPQKLPMLAVAGIWNPSAGETPASVALITRSANADLEEVHHRMPVLLNRDQWEEWLDPGLHDREILTAMMGPVAPQQLMCRAVNPAVNSVRAEGPELIAVWAQPVSTDFAATHTPQLFPDDFGS
jgi:putative SOS response-associated peptidase YedK